MNGSHSGFQQRIPNFFAIYEFGSPIETTLSVDNQVRQCLENTRLLHYNTEAAKAYGFCEQGELRGKSIWQLASAMSCCSADVMRAMLTTQLEQFVANHYNLDELAIESTVDGVARHFTITYQGFLEQGKLIRLLVLYQDNTAAVYHEALVSNIAQNLAAESGDVFFARLAQRLANTLGVDYALMAECSDSEEDAVRILSYYHQESGTFIDSNELHSLRNTLGANVLKGQTCIFESGLLSAHPENEKIQRLQIDSLVAVPILGEQDRVLGFLALMHGQPMVNIELVKSVLNIFSIRASAELERRNHAQEQQRRQLLQHLFIENSTSGMFVANIDPPMPLDLSVHQQVQWVAEHSSIVDVNPAFLKLFGFKTPEQVVGSSFFNEHLQYDFATTIRDFIADNFQFMDYLIRFTLGESDRWVSSNASGITDDGELVQILGMMTDVTERILQSQEMEYRAKHDSLTGLPNRSYFIDQVDQARKLSIPGSKHALLLLDLDGFKEVNDTLGHEMGDYLLQQIGPRFESILPKGQSLLARLGGDEFAIFVENYGEIDELKMLAASLIGAIKSPFSINELELVIGGSIGISLYPDNADSVTSLMRCADVAMYQSKKESVDFRFYSTEQDHYTVRRLSLMMDIRQAIENEELQLFYQPIVDLVSQAPISFEALIRWQHPQHGLLSPAEFIPLIELTDMIMPVTGWVVETAVRQLSEWKERDWPYRISVNVSTRNLIDMGFANFIAGCLQRYGVEGDRLEIEITESTLMADPEKARTLLQSIAELGCQISVDDYGTGYSSLGYLKSLPLNTLKIDRSFICQMTDDSQDQIIVNSTIQLAHNLGLEVTAEGIEDLQLVNSLVAQGCDKGQGYYFCRPIPIAELENWLNLQGRVAVGGEI